MMLKETFKCLGHSIVIFFNLTKFNQLILKMKFLKTYFIPNIQDEAF